MLDILNVIVLLKKHKNGEPLNDQKPIKKYNPITNPNNINYQNEVTAEQQNRRQRPPGNRQNLSLKAQKNKQNKNINTNTRNSNNHNHKQLPPRQPRSSSPSQNN